MLALSRPQKVKCFCGPRHKASINKNSCLERAAFFQIFILFYNLHVLMVKNIIYTPDGCFLLAAIESTCLANKVVSHSEVLKENMSLQD